MTLKAALLATTAAIAMTGTASAATMNGFYVGVEGGISIVDDISMFETRNAGATAFNADIEHDNGWAIMGTVGYAWTQWRFEFEAGYRSNDINAIAFNTGANFPDAGDLQELSLMANMLYDIPLNNSFSLSLGGGVGFDEVKFNWATFGASGLDDDDWGFAYQAIVGLNYALTPQAELFVNYRYLNVNGPDYAQGVYTFSFDDVTKQAATIGLRYHFGP